MNLKEKVEKHLVKLSDKQVHKLRVYFEQDKIARQVEEDADVLETHYSPDAGAVGSFIRRKQSEARTKNAVQQSGEISAAAKLRSKINDAKVDILASAHALEHAPERLDELRERERAINENMIETAKEATARKTDTPTLNLLIQEEHRTNQAITLEREKAQIEVEKTKALNEHQVEMDFQRVMNTLVAITRYNHLTYDAFDEVRSRLIALVKEAHQIEMSNVNVHLKGQIMSKMQLAIDAYQEVFDAFRRRLVESGDGQETRQIASITELAGGGESGNPAAPFKLHSAESGDRD